MAYTAIDDPSAFFQTTLYTGTGSSLVVTNGGNSDLQPDWVWIKPRAITEGHFLTDSVRGVRQTIRSYRTNAEETESQGLTAFSSDGFTMGTNSDINTDDEPGVAWQWKAGTSFSNDASSTSVGSIDSAGSVNTDAGFSIMTYTGTGSNATFAHGLGAVPKMAIFKDRSGTGYWMTYHVSIGNGANLVLNATDASSAASVWWNSTTPTSSVFSIGTSNNINVSGRNYVGYLFAEKKGYSKIASYIGNGNANGPYIHLGFKPAWILIKRSSNAGNDWGLFDNKRLGFNVDNEELRPSATDVEQTDDRLDILSNGFKIKSAGAGFNASGDTFIYMAFAENPFVTSTGVPATAR